jgi:amino acid transporter
MAANSITNALFFVHLSILASFILFFKKKRRKEKKKRKKKGKKEG